MNRRAWPWLTATCLLAGCLNTHDAVVSTAAVSTDAWECADDKTEVTELGSGRYRLGGCGEHAIYNCNFAFTPPRCWK